MLLGAYWRSLQGQVGYRGFSAGDAIIGQWEKDSSHAVDSNWTLDLRDFLPKLCFAKNPAVDGVITGQCKKDLHRFFFSA